MTPLRSYADFEWLHCVQHYDDIFLYLAVFRGVEAIGLVTTE